MEAGLAGDVGALIGQGRDDARGRGLGEAGFVRHLDDAGPLGCGERVRRRGTLGTRAAVAAREAVARLPTLRRARVDAGQGTGRGEPGAADAGLLDGVQQDLAIFQAGHASSPLRKIAESFFESTSKAAVSAKALSLRLRSRSSSLIRRRAGSPLCVASVRFAA